jgi:hypothetical protein
MTGLAVVLDVMVVLLLAHTVVNAVVLRRPPDPAQVGERVSVLIPMRDEVHQVKSCLSAVLAQQNLSDREVLVYDDGSTDGTGDAVRRVGDERVQVLTGPPPRGPELGKPLACARLAAAATGSILVFVDADVVLAPDAVARSVAMLRGACLDLVSPYPRQVAVSVAERSVQPLLQWAWLTFLPLRLSERSSRPSLAAANGQFLVVDATAYRAAGGHDAVVSEVVDDVALARVLHRTGARGGFVDGTSLATCRMYGGTRALVDGYAKSLWCAFGSPVGGLLTAAGLLGLYVVPWVLVPWTPWAWPAAIGGLLGRVIAAERVGSRMVPDTLAHPLSVLMFTALVVVSIRRHRQGRTTWRGRVLP